MSETDGGKLVFFAMPEGLVNDHGRAGRCPIDDDRDGIQIISQRYVCQQLDKVLTGEGAIRARLQRRFLEVAAMRGAVVKFVGITHRHFFILVAQELADISLQFLAWQGLWSCPAVGGERGKGKKHAKSFEAKGHPVLLLLMKWSLLCSLWINTSKPDAGLASVEPA
jgi:hypothetical protein